MESPSKILILNNQEILKRLHRMAFEIYENNFDIKELIIIGMNQRGGFLAESILDYLKKVSPLSIQYCRADVDRETDPVSYGIQLPLEPENLQGKEIVVVDDVLYTGRTLLNIVSILLQAGPKSIQTCVLVDRGHRSMPISPDYVGVELATTLQQHVSIEVDWETQEVQAFLL